MPHPQQHEVERAISTFLTEASRSLEVVYVDPHKDAAAIASTPIGDYIEAVHLPIARGFFLFKRTVREPRLRVELHNRPERRAVAERLGFEVKTRTAFHPAHGAVEIAYAQKAFTTAERGAALCIEWLQQASNIGDAWLWVTDLPYDHWPRPLPRPAVWPPAG